jgi:hypothetical protein
MIIMTEPMKMVRLRPSMLPSQMVATAPKKHPRVYAPTLGRVSRDSPVPLEVATYP